MIEIGQKAPEFSLYNSEKVKIHLSDYKGKNVLLLFFPLAFSGVCTKELCSIRDNMASYSQVNAQVLGISVDSIYTLAKFKEVQGLNFPLLSDFNKEVSGIYDSLYETFGYDMKGVSRRSAFIIDRDGILRYVEILANASELPNFEAINSILQKMS